MIVLSEALNFGQIRFKLAQLFVRRLSTKNSSSVFFDAVAGEVQGSRMAEPLEGKVTALAADNPVGGVAIRIH